MGKLAEQHNKDFMACYDVDDSDGSATINWFKVALNPKWKATFKKIFYKQKRKEQDGK